MLQVTDVLCANYNVIVGIINAFTYDLLLPEVLTAALAAGRGLTALSCPGHLPCSVMPEGQCSITLSSGQRVVRPGRSKGRLMGGRWASCKL